MKAKLVNKIIADGFVEYNDSRYDFDGVTISHVINDKIFCTTESYTNPDYGEIIVSRIFINGKLQMQLINEFVFGIFETDDYYIIVKSGEQGTVPILIDKNTFEIIEGVFDEEIREFIIPIINDYRDRCIIYPADTSFPLRYTRMIVYTGKDSRLHVKFDDICTVDISNIPAENIKDAVYCVKDTYSKVIYIIGFEMYADSTKLRMSEDVRVAGFYLREHHTVLILHYDTCTVELPTDRWFRLNGHKFVGCDGIVKSLKKAIKFIECGEKLYKMQINGLELDTDGVIPQLSYDKYVLTYHIEHAEYESTETKTTAVGNTIAYEVYEISEEETQATNMFAMLIPLLQVLLYVALFIAIIKSITNAFKIR